MRILIKLIPKGQRGFIKGVFLLVFASSLLVIGKQQIFANKVEKSDAITTQLSTNPAETNEGKKTDQINNRPGQNTSNTISVTTPSLFTTVQQGGWVMIPIMLFGLIATTLVFERTIFFLRTKAYKRERLAAYLKDKMKESKAIFREEAQEELERATTAFIQSMERGVNFLIGIGNIAPIVGFFGTVIGMIEAFAAIAAATTVNAKVVASGIQVALITTAGGLSVAVPAIFFYYIFMHIVQKSNSQADEIIEAEIQHLPRLLTQGIKGSDHAS